MERWGGVREYAGRVDFLYVLHRQLDRVARVRGLVHGSDASGMNVFDYAPLTQYISAVEALCIMLPKQLREECGCAVGVDALWRLRGLDMLAHQFYKKGCEELLEQDEKLRKMLEEEREKAKEQGGKARAQPAAQPAQLAALEIHGWERWLRGAVAARSPPAGGKPDTLKELERLVNDEEWRRKVSSCEELEREMEEEERLIEEVLRSAGIVVKTYGDLGWLPLKIIAVADAVVQRIVDVLDAHQLLIPGRRVAVGVLRGEAGRADRVGVEE
jgi:hypothetical protein